MKERLKGRTFVINIDNINLDSLEGQNYLMLECEKALASADLSPFDLKVITALANIIKLKKDIDALRMAEQFRAKLKEIEEKLNNIERARQGA